MRPTTMYVTSAAEYDKHKERLKQSPCPKCRAVGCLIRHGYLKGHGDEANDEVRRGWRIFCSDRNLRKGCGRTHSVLLAKFIFRHMVNTQWLWQLLQHIRQGMSVKAAWEKIASPFCLETGYRLRQAFTKSQTFIRSMLLRPRSPRQQLRLADGDPVVRSGYSPSRCALWSYERAAAREKRRRVSSVAAFLLRFSGGHIVIAPVLPPHLAGGQQHSYPIPLLTPSSVTSRLMKRSTGQIDPAPGGKEV